jgi:hypothetical protein
MSRAQEVADQFSTLAAGFLQWSAEARRSVMSEIRSIVVAQVDELGVATKQDLDDLRARIDRLERERSPSKRSRESSGTTTRRTSASTAKSSSASGKASGKRRSAPSSSATKRASSPASSAKGASGGRRPRARRPQAARSSSSSSE